MDRRQKVRRYSEGQAQAIDDFSEYFVNACTTIEDKIPVAGVDAIVNFAKFWSDKILQALESKERSFTITLSDGSTRVGVLHSDFSLEDTKLTGKCLDLDSAYKQCPVAPAHARFSVFALKEPDTGEVKFFIARALPFGASAAVHGFNRAAMALNHLVHEYIGVPCTHYFDDFTIIVPKVLASTIDLTTKRFFEILGWEVKSAKDKPMDEEFTALGVEIALHDP